MRILIHDYGGYSFSIEISRELALRGYDVLYLYGKSTQLVKRAAFGERLEDGSNFSSTGIELSRPFQKYSYFRRWSQEREYGRLLAEKIEKYNPNVVLSANTPLDAQLMALRRCNGLEIPFAFWLQDVIGIATHKILKKRIPGVGALIGKYYIRLERQMLAQSNRVILITEDFLPLMKKWGINEHKISVIPNWAPVEQFPILPKDNIWSQNHGLADKFCFMYTGTLGLKHNPELLLQLALHFQNDPSVRVVVVSEGLGAQWLRDQKMKNGLDNLIIENFQPFEQLPLTLAAADVLVGILEEDAGIFSVPSKVLTYLCARRPLLLAVPPQNLAARIVMQNDAGIVVNSNDEGAFVSAAERLYEDNCMRDRCGQNGRAYAENNFDIRAIADRFEKSIFMSEVVQSL